MSSEDWQGYLMALTYTLIPLNGDPMAELDFCVRSVEKSDVPLDGYLRAIRSALASDESVSDLLELEQYSDTQLRDFLRAAERKIAAKLGQ